MARSGERAIAGVTSGTIGLGEEVTWEARHFGIRWRLTSRITAYDRPLSFVDEQVHGPFASWWHFHGFEPENGGTRMIDRVRYQPPLSVVGRLVDEMVLRRYIAGLLNRRNEFIKKALEGGPK